MTRAILFIILIYGTTAVLALPKVRCEKVADQRYWAGPEGNAGLEITASFTTLTAMSETLRLDSLVSEMNGEPWFLADILVRTDLNANGRSCSWLVSGPQPVIAKYQLQLRKLSADQAILRDFGVKDICIQAESTSSATLAAAEPRIGTPMRRLLEAFRKASPPSAAQLLGRWVAIRTISTEDFITGRQGPDRESFDERGLRRRQEPGAPLEWTIVIGEVDHKLTVKSHPVWSAETEYPLDLKRGSELFLAAQFDGDTDETFRCRVSSSTNLVCLLMKHEYGDGVEFRQMTK